MSQEQPQQPPNQKPDHTLANATVDSQNEPPMVYAVTDLRAYVRPELAEELGSLDGGVANCGTEVICTCVPVETCVCNTVSHDTCSSNCACIGNNCYGCYTYWY